MLPQRLRQKRKQKKITQQELANLVNTKKNTISNYETGYSTPSNDMLVDLARALHTSTDYLLGVTDNDSPAEGNEKELDLDKLYPERTKNMDKLVKLFNSVSPEIQETMLKQAELLAEIDKNRS
jgi:transcriptional regulator with XRE-family HTH domain